ncbi:16S rRNA (guanine(527)-N(7))-methyltransferase RsmG [Lachnoclostridium sp. Marseille-P6806]|uniref:16S rRNA (guanine(527)-N(7))-methyltransferase RsmG n=1 Tax=Lachnoclostridium sp. Marseille-P6806 TaxID=2364793 RepID=UPI001032691D|nr:16S rRNA (guanine(527)-N(7))-methyltransferase RsmG [Lachnoclostridium sp. Marseille-P6806]
MFHVKQFREQAEEWGIHLSDRQMELFYWYYCLLVDWNAVMNLTAIIDLPEVLTKHFLDSLSIVYIYDIRKLEEGIELIDVGTGAGFPGVPLAIAFPETRVTLVDSLNKRVRFLTELIERLQLRNCSAIHARAEELARAKEYREHFALAAARAVAEMRVLCEYELPFVKTGGEFIAYKSEKAGEEMERSERAIQILGGKKKKEISFYLPGTDYGRTLISIEKVKITPKKYPRKAGTPAKTPLE